MKWRTTTVVVVFSPQREKNRIAHSAFTLAAVKKYVQVYGVGPQQHLNAMQSGERYIRRSYRRGLCNYALALSAYSIISEPSYVPRSVKDSMIVDLKSRVVTSKLCKWLSLLPEVPPISLLSACITNVLADPSACFVCNRCPTNGNSSDASGGVDCVGLPKGEGSAACVETTAYTLLALLEAGDTESTVCLTQWLVMIRRRSGGFYTSQVFIQLLLRLV